MKTLALIAAMILCGCGDTEAPADAAASEAAAPVAAIDPGALDATGLAVRSLAASSLPQMQMLTTSDGRELLARVVSCALPQGTAITAITRDGTPYQFAGAHGYAPGWADHAPSSDERHKVTECITGKTRDAHTAVAVRTPIRTRR
jgi:hypothetical protein